MSNNQPGVVDATPALIAALNGDTGPLEAIVEATEAASPLTPAGYDVEREGRKWFVTYRGVRLADAGSFKTRQLAEAEAQRCLDADAAMNQDPDGSLTIDEAKAVYADDDSDVSDHQAEVEAAAGALADVAPTVDYASMSQVERLNHSRPERHALQAWRTAGADPATKPATPALDWMTDAAASTANVVPMKAAKAAAAKTPALATGAAVATATRANAATIAPELEAKIAAEINARRAEGATWKELGIRFTNLPALFVGDAPLSEHQLYTIAKRLALPGFSAAAAKAAKATVTG
jgi:hypothetical protein